MFWVRAETKAEMLAKAGIDPTTAWADDPGLSPMQRAALRSLGRTKGYRMWLSGRSRAEAHQGSGGMDRETQERK